MLFGTRFAPVRRQESCISSGSTANCLAAARKTGHSIPPFCSGRLIHASAANVQNHHVSVADREQRAKPPGTFAEQVLTDRRFDQVVLGSQGTSLRIIGERFERDLEAIQPLASRIGGMFGGKSVVVSQVVLRPLG